jgi:phage-related protein
MAPSDLPDLKPVEWIGGARDALRAMPEEVRDNFGYALYQVYVLHAFQKKSKRGIATPKHELTVIRRRWKEAKWHYATHYQQLPEPKED